MSDNLKTDVGQPAIPLLPASNGSAATWQPIETATKDGTRLLLWAAGSAADEIEVGYWSTSVWTYGGGWINCENRSDTVVLKPTHWMPLPMPPNEGTTQELIPVGSSDVFGCDWEGKPITGQEPANKLVLVWQITPHPTDSSFDTCVERDYHKAVELAKEAIENWVDQADEECLKGDGVTVSMKLILMRLDEYQAVQAEGD